MPTSWSDESCAAILFSFLASAISAKTTALKFSSASRRNSPPLVIYRHRSHTKSDLITELDDSSR
jgi:hypothetical protein